MSILACKNVESWYVGGSDLELSHHSAASPRPLSLDAAKSKWFDIVVLAYPGC